MPSKIIPCAACQTNLELDADYYQEAIGGTIKCPSCNADVWVYSEKDAPSQTDPLGDSECAKCGKHNRSGSAFCVECGASLASSKPAGQRATPRPSERPRCAKCGSLYRQGMAFCMKCGAKVQDKESVSPAMNPRFDKQSIVLSADDLQSEREPDAPDQNPSRPLRTSAAVPEARIQPCPSCAAPVLAGNVICLRCGLDFRTGRKISRRDTSESPPPAGLVVAGYLLSLLIPIVGLFVGLSVKKRYPSSSHGHAIFLISVIWMALQFVGGCTAGILIPSFNKAKILSQMKGSVNNLRIMDAAKEQAAMEQGWAAGQEVRPGSSQEREVLVYVRGNTIPVCPAGGTYTWNPIGTDPTCSIGGHTL